MSKTDEKQDAAQGIEVETVSFVNKVHVATGLVGALSSQASVRLHIGLLMGIPFLFAKVGVGLPAIVPMQNVSGLTLKADKLARDADMAAQAAAQVVRAEALAKQRQDIAIATSEARKASSRANNP